MNQRGWLTGAELSKLAAPDPFAASSSKTGNSTSTGSKTGRVAQNTLLTMRGRGVGSSTGSGRGKRFQPYASKKCKDCNSSVTQNSAIYCHGQSGQAGGVRLRANHPFFCQVAPIRRAYAASVARYVVPHCIFLLLSIPGRPRYKCVYNELKVAEPLLERTFLCAIANCARPTGYLGEPYGPRTLENNVDAGVITGDALMALSPLLPCSPNRSTSSSSDTCELLLTMNTPLTCCEIF